MMRAKLKAEAADRLNGGFGFAMALEHPDGRQCSTCTHRDCMDDPVSLKFGIKEQMWWGAKPSGATGESVQYECGYCMRIYFSRVRPTCRVWET